MEPPETSEQQAAAPEAAAPASEPGASGVAAPIAAVGGANPAEVVIRTFVDSLTRLARINKEAVREAGGIAPLVMLLRSGTEEVQALAAAVLRELASDSLTNKEAILKANGVHALVEMVRNEDTEPPAAGEAAGALCALSTDFPNGCRSIVEDGGVEGLTALIAKAKDGTQAPIQAAATLFNLTQASEANCQAILRIGGVQTLIQLLCKSHLLGGRKRIVPDMKSWLERASEKAATTLWSITVQGPACNAAMREANAIEPLVQTLLRAGLNSSTADYSARLQSSYPHPHSVPTPSASPFCVLATWPPHVTGVVLTRFVPKRNRPRRWSS